MNWRIYRLPGSRGIWHIDAGEGTPVLNVAGYRAAETYSVDIGDGWPRAWIAVDGQELHIVKGIAIFELPGVFDAVKESIEISTGRIAPPAPEMGHN